MASRFRLFSKRILIFGNAIVIFFFLLSSLAPYLNPRNWWFISFFGLAFPFLLLLMVLCLAAWLIPGKFRFVLINGFVLLVCYKSLLVFFAFHRPDVFVYKKEPASLRIITWNVDRFIELRRNNNKGSQTRQKMFDLIKKQEADILCLQEFHSSTRGDYYDNITAIRQELGYPYFYFSFDTDGDSLYYSSIIFSRYPVIDSGFIRYPRPTLPDVLLHADIKVNEDTIRVYTSHLQSLQLKKRDLKAIQDIKTGEDSLFSHSRSILSKLKKGISDRSIQADIISEVVKNCPHPVLFCGDLNDIPNSYTYHTVRGNMQDAFLKKGFGIGRTFTGLSPTLRIDYIFADDHFKIEQFNRIAKNLSDHYMLVADMHLKPGSPGGK